MIQGSRINLAPYTSEYCHYFFQKYVEDQMFSNRVFQYNAEKVEAYFQLKGWTQQDVCLPSCLGKKSSVKSS